MNQRTEDLRDLRQRVSAIESNLAEVHERMRRLEKSAQGMEIGGGETAVVETMPEDAGEWFREEAHVVAAPEVPPPLPDAPSPRREPEPEPVEPKGPPAWQGWLQRLQLWPPQDEGNLEVRLGAWWATRIGALLAVIGVVFFGVYLSLDTSPAVKFVELLALALGVTVGGRWLERRLPRFGVVVLAAGLAMSYFAIYAGYAVSAVKVFHSPWLAAAAQLLAAGALAVVAVRKRHETVATVALALGFVTVWFSRSGGLGVLALVTALVLATGGVMAWRRLRWKAPALVGMAGGYAIWALLLRDVAAGVAIPRPFMWVGLAALAWIGFARDWRRPSVTDAAGTVDGLERRFQLANTSVAALSGVAAGLWVWRQDLGLYYVGATLALGAMAGLRRRQVPGDVVAPVLLAKAVGAAGLTVIEFTDGRTTALALLVQAAVLWVTAQRTRSTVMAWASPLAAWVAAGFFVRFGLVGAEVVSITAVGQGGFALGLLALGAEWRRKLEGADSDRELWQVVHLGGVGAAILFGAWSVWHGAPTVGQPLAALVLAGLAAAWAGMRRSVWPLAGSAAWLVLAHVRLWVELQAGTVLGELVIALVLVEAVSVVAAVGVVRGWGRGGDVGTQRARAADALAMVALATVVQTGFALWRPDMALAATSSLALVVGLAAGGTRRLAWTWLASGVLALGALNVELAANAMWRPAWLALAALPVVGLLVWRRATALGRASESDWAGVDYREAGTTLVATGLALAAVHGLAGKGAQLGWLIALMGVALGVAWRPGVRAALPAAWVFGAVSILVGIGGVIPIGAAVAGLVVAWISVVGLAAWREQQPEVFSTPFWWRHAVGVQATLATVLTVVLVPEIVSEESYVLTLALVTGLAMGLARWRGIPAMDTASRVLGLWTAAVAVIMASGLGINAWAAAAVLAALPWIGAWGRSMPRWTWSFAGLGLGLAMLTALSPQMPVGHIATVAWGAAAMAVFMLGLFARLRQHRLVGLVGLACCIVRVFVVDLDETLHRIIAFGVLGLVLLWVGFSYHRFRHLIVDEAVAPDDESVEGEEPRS